MNRPAEEILKKCLSLIFLLTATTILRAQVPVASFTASKDSGCAPLQVQFQNTSSGAISYHWTLGNGNVSTLPNPSASYVNPGIYQVVLIATSATGQKDTAMNVVTILADPVADFSANILSSCEDFNLISFTNLSTGANSYIWDFGDGSSAASINATHTYNTPGTYNVKLIATNNFGCQDIAIKSAYITILANPVATIGVSQSSSCNVNTNFQFTSGSANISTWNWSFGDGATSTIQNPSHQYGAAGSFPVTLIVTGTNGCVDTATAANNITIGSSLVPSFTMDDSAGCGPLTIQFDCTVPDAVTWSWDFGDGTTSTADNPSHTYNSPGSYSITLSVTTVSGCNGSVTYNNLVVVDAPPIVNFTVAQDSGCIPYTAQFVNLTSGAATYNWQFGNSDSSTLPNPTTVYTIGGFFSVTLIATSPNGCQAALTKTQLVKVFAPTAKFSGTPLIGCPGMTVQFTHIGNNLNVISYLWNFGDGTTSTLQNPSHTYTTIGNYNVWLIVRNSFGCADTVYKANYVKVVSGTTAYTVPDTLLVCQNNPIAFTDPTIGSNVWNWSFGNGSGSTAQSPSAIYTAPGIYTVTLQTNMPGGCIQNFNPYAIVHVIPYIPEPIVVNYNNPCKPYTVAFSTATQNVTAYSWNFGDGSTSTLANPVHIYQQAGTYNVVLSLTIGAGCLAELNTTITLGHTNPIQASTQDLCLGSPVQFSLTTPLAFTATNWNFGDGNSSTQQQPQHTYAAAGSYNVALVTMDTSGCIDTFQLAAPIVVNNPLPSFTANTVSCLNAPLTFTNTSQNASSYLWDFGDGSTSTDQDPTHAYTTAGTYTITLTATQNSCSVTQTFTGYVSVVDPLSQFTFTTSGQCMPVTVNFTDQSNNAVSWIWYFGNGDSSLQQNPVYTYLTDPSDSIRLIMTDVNGCVDTSAQAPFPYYAAGAMVDDATGCIPDTVFFTDISNGALSWHWDFGDGTTDTQQNPVHIYNNNGTFTVTLVATFPGGCLDTIVYTDLITVSSPIADFYSPSVAGCSPTQITFNNTTSDATIFAWDFGDGGISSNVNPQHIYYIPGTYDITLIAINDFGCTDTVTKPAYISIPGTYTQFGISTLSGCQGQGIQFTDSSINAVDWTWDFGDGSADNSQDPNHVYNDTGSYTVTLITLDSIGCTSSYTYPSPIVIHPKPTAAATVSDSTGCSFFSTNFNNNSTGATQYEWTFGDGDTSTQTGPSHTYLSGGLYFPELIAISAFGCRDTFTFSSAVDVLQTPTAVINAVDTTGCEPAVITFNNASQLEENPTYSWYTDNGITGTGATFQPLFNLNNTYVVSLITTNANGCADTTSLSVTVHPTPVASATVDLTIGCNPLQVQFTNSSTGAATYTWDFANGSSATTSDPAFVYPDSGYFEPMMIASNGFGCSDTFLFAPGITVLQSPTAAFTVNSQQICFEETADFTDQSTGLVSPVYAWDFGFTTSTQQNPSIICGTSGTYDVSLIVTNSNGCSDTITQAQYLIVSDTIAPPIDPIASASVLSDTETEITWFNSSANDVAAYLLYRYNPATANWDLIHSDNAPVPASTAATTAYIDTALNTKGTSYSYKLQTIDECGYTYPLDSLTAHTTINISTTGNGLTINVSWTPYAGCNFNEYRLYRTELPSGSPVLIATLPSSTLQYTDTSILCPVQYNYRIQTDDLCARPFNSWSDTSAIWPENIFEDQQSSLVRTTVVDDQYTLTEWLPPTVHPDRVTEYQIFRSTDNINFTQVGTVPAGITSYNDMDVDVDQNSYTYRVIVVNDCGTSGPESNIGKSILVEGFWKDYRTYLNWTPYLLWNTGVERYIIEYLTPQGVWVPIREVDGSTISTEIDD
jgi:PKD repeat protein